MDETIAKRFGTKTELKSRTVTIYPKSAEREMQRLVGAFFVEISKNVKSIRLDAKDEKEEKRWEKLALSSALILRLTKVAKQVENQTLREWKRCVSETLGVDIPDAYYYGLYAAETNKWLLDTMKQLSALPGEARQAAKKVIQKCVKAGKSLTEIKREVSKKLSSLKRQAKARAVSAVAALFGILNRTQQRDAGCGKYVWRSARDSRVRPCHRELDGHIFEWSNPPEMWRETAHGRVYTGKRCNPGEDWGCRCIAIPVFEARSITLPEMED